MSHRPTITGGRLLTALVVSAALATSTGAFAGATATAAPTFGLSSVTLEGNPRHIIATEFTADGDVDLATSNLFSSHFKGLSTLIGKGNGTFTTTNHETTGFTQDVGSGNFSGSGKTDALIMTSGTLMKEDTAVDFPGNGEGGFGAAVFTEFLDPLGSFAVGDFNEDGKPDIVALYPAGNDALFGAGNGKGGFGALTGRPISGAGSGATDIAAGDLNGDGKLDIAATNRTEGTVSTLLGNGEGGLGEPTVFHVGTNPTAVTIGDLNGDGKADIVTTNEGSKTVSVLLNKGEGKFNEPVSYSTGGTGPAGVALGDFNDDGKVDLVVSNDESKTVGLLLGNGEGTFKEATTYSAGEGPQGLVAADLNNDGRLDLAVADSKGEAVGILLNTSLPTIAASPGSLAFPKTKVGKSSTAKSVTVTNEGSAPLKITAMPIGGVNPTAFAKSADTCTGTTLKVGANCSVSIKFQPEAKGAASAKLQSESNAATQISVELTGTGA